MKFFSKISARNAQIQTAKNTSEKITFFNFIQIIFYKENTIFFWKKKFSMKIFSKISAHVAQFQTARNTILKITFLHLYTNKNLQEKKYFFWKKKY